MKLYIFICTRVQRKKQAYTFSNYTFSNWNKPNPLINVPKKETHHESDDLNRIN